MRAEFVSLDASIVVTGLSKRTLWRRVSDGALQKAGEDARGRVLLYVDEVIRLMHAPLSMEDGLLLVKADAGDADAQADLAISFHERHEFDVAVYWWQLAAEQGHADAMQWLGRCHAAGEGVQKNETLAMMWISKAASSGHQIAAQQLTGLLQRGLLQSAAR